MVRTPCCRAEGLKKGAWTPEEDKKLVDYVNRHGEGGWRTLPDKAGLKRCGKSCRLRWANYLRPDIKRGEFSEDEEDSIIKLHAIHGNKWSAIARRLAGRTDNEIKNHWNTHIKKRLIKKGIDPLTHEPISGDTNKPSNQPTTPEKSDLQEDDHQKLNHKKSLRSSSAKFLNRVANKFGQKINLSVMSDIIGSGGPLTSHTSTPNESEKSTSSNSSTPNLQVNHKMMSVDTTTTPMSSSTFTSNDPFIYCDIVGDIDGFTPKFLSDDVVSRDVDEDFSMLDDESCVENTLFMKELSMILQEDNSQSNTMSFEDDIDFKMINEVVDHSDDFEEVDNYFSEYLNLVN